MTALLSSPLSAFAQSDEQRAAARDLATSGLDAFKAGKYDEALDSFTKAESLFHALPHLLFIARSQVKLGHYVKGREAYMKVVKEVLPANASQASRDAQSSASSEVSNIEGKIARITIKVEGKEKVKDLSVAIDGAPIAAVLIGVPTAVDPGDHKIEGLATGYKGSAQVTVAAGARQDVALKLEPDASAVPPAAVGVAPAAGAETPPPASTPPPAANPPPPNQPPAADQGTSSGTNGLRIGSYVAFGVGAVGLIGGTIFYLQGSGKSSDADKLCTLPGGACDTTVEDKVKSLDSDAKSAKTLGVVGFIVGGVGVGAGVTLFVLSNKKKDSATTISPWVGLSSAGVRGTF